MLRQLIKAIAHLGRDQRGNVFILFAASALPLLLVMGGAIDITRYARYKAELANAVDAAALALARQGEGYNEEQATTFVRNYVTSFPVGDNEFTVQDFDVELTTRGYIVSADGAMKTIFLPLGYFAPTGEGIMSMDMDIVSEVVRGSNQVELALVFDNTGSMAWSAGSNPCGTGSTRMAGLKCAAKTLVEDLMDEMNESGGDDKLKVALVPFEGSVNVNVSSTNPPSWIEWSDESTTDDSTQPYYTGINFNKKKFSGVKRRLGPRWFYEKLGVSWAGCVEMRAEPYDVLDTAPTASIPNTLFVPMFWPDEPDYYDAWNNYLEDEKSGNWDQRQRNLKKYSKSSPSQVNWHSGKKDTTYPYSYGPNRGCPRPLTPLTTNETTILNAINAMQSQGATGTFIPVGLAWGWHVLSPNAPYTEGIGPEDEDYAKTVKAIVLLTDGENSPSISITDSDNWNKGTFSAYNYPGTAVNLNIGSGNKVRRRLQNLNVNSDPSESIAKTNLDGKTSTLCTNAKDGGIRLYTITFGSIGESTKTLMRNCASKDTDGNPLYFDAPNSQELDDIFQTIGEDLSEIHLAM